jgi:hypothetical protein
MNLLSRLRNAGRLQRARRALEHLGTDVRGPFLTPQRNSIYLVDACILTESEVVRLSRAGRQSLENVGKALSEFRRLQTS